MRIEPATNSSSRHGREDRHERIDASLARLTGPLSVLERLSVLRDLAEYWHALWRFNNDDAGKQDYWLLTSDLAAYHVACNAKAWRLFCQGLQLDPDFVTRSNYFGGILGYCEPVLADATEDRDELIQRLRPWLGDEAGRLITPEDLLGNWQRVFDQCTSRTMGSCERRAATP